MQPDDAEQVSGGAVERRERDRPTIIQLRQARDESVRELFHLRKKAQTQIAGGDMAQQIVDRRLILRPNGPHGRGVPTGMASAATTQDGRAERALYRHG